MKAYKLYDEMHELGYFKTFYGVLDYILNHYYDLEVIDELKKNDEFMKAYNDKVEYDSSVVKILDEELIYVEMINIRD